MLLAVVAKNMLRSRVYYLYLYLFLSKTIIHLHWPVLRSFHNFKTGNRDWTTNKQQLQSTAAVSTATINTWTWVCHYSLCFMRTLCAPFWFLHIELQLIVRNVCVSVCVCCCCYSIECKIPCVRIEFRALKVGECCMSHTQKRWKI